MRPRGGAGEGSVYLVPIAYCLLGPLNKSRNLAVIWPYLEA